MSHPRDRRFSKRLLHRPFFPLNMQFHSSLFLLISPYELKNRAPRKCICVLLTLQLCTESKLWSSSFVVGLFLITEIAVRERTRWLRSHMSKRSKQNCSNPVGDRSVVVG